MLSIRNEEAAVLEKITGGAMAGGCLSSAYPSAAAVENMFSAWNPRILENRVSGATDRNSRKPTRVVPNQESRVFPPKHAPVEIVLFDRML